MYANLEPFGCALLPKKSEDLPKPDGSRITNPEIRFHGLYLPLWGKRRRNDPSRII